MLELLRVRSLRCANTVGRKRLEYFGRGFIDIILARSRQVPAILDQVKVLFPCHRKFIAFFSDDFLRLIGARAYVFGTS